MLVIDGGNSVREALPLTSPVRTGSVVGVAGEAERQPAPVGRTWPRQVRDSPGRDLVATCATLARIAAAARPGDGAGRRTRSANTGRIEPGPARRGP